MPFLYKDKKIIPNTTGDIPEPKKPGWKSSRKRRKSSKSENDASTLSKDLLPPTIESVKASEATEQIENPAEPSPPQVEPVQTLPPQVEPPRVEPPRVEPPVADLLPPPIGSVDANLLPPAIPVAEALETDQSESIADQEVESNALPDDLPPLPTPAAFAEETAKEDRDAESTNLNSQTDGGVDHLQDELLPPSTKSVSKTDDDQNANKTNADDLLPKSASANDNDNELDFAIIDPIQIPTEDGGSVIVSESFSNIDYQGQKVPIQVLRRDEKESIRRIRSTLVFVVCGAFLLAVAYIIYLITN